MLKILEIVPGFAVAGAIAIDDLAALAGLGYRTIVNNRPDGEDPSGLPSAKAAAEAHRLGLLYRYVPATPYTLFTDEVVDGMASALGECPGPMLAHCRSGHRSAIVWAAARSRVVPPHEVVCALEAAGIDAAPFRDDLDNQAGRALWRPEAAIRLPS